jgi:hypothetical protein
VSKPTKEFDIVEPETPMLDKELGIRDDATTIGEFLDWLQENYGSEQVFDLNFRDLLHEYFEIDADQAETERRKLLVYQRMLNTREQEKKELRV